MPIEESGDTKTYLFSIGIFLRLMVVSMLGLWPDTTVHTEVPLWSPDPGGTHLLRDTQSPTYIYIPKSLWSAVDCEKEFDDSCSSQLVFSVNLASHFAISLPYRHVFVENQKHDIIL